MSISIIYEDKEILVINKPPGLSVHADGKRNEQTLADWILEKYPRLRSIGERVVLNDGTKILRPGIVHRLDKDTSGILLIAKDQETFLFFKKQFQNHKIKKAYKALVYGEVKKKEGTIDLPIGRSKKDFRKKTADNNARGNMREALTKYKVLKKNSEYSFLDVYPKTGRTHQIRVHLSTLGHPVVCDSLYAPKRVCPKELGRLALHAFSLEFQAQIGTSMRIEAPLPEDIDATLETFFNNLRSS